MDVYSIGEMLIDFIPGAEPASYIRKAGGAPANVAIAAAKNELTVGMCCSVGDDDFGRFLLDVLKEYNVQPMKPSLCRDAITTMAFVTLNADNDRSFTFARKPGADMFLYEDDVKQADIENTVMVHAGSFSLAANPAAKATEKALRLGHELGKLVSFDVNYRDVVWNNDQKACAEAVKKLLPYIDLMKVSDEEVDMMGGEAEIPALMEKNNIAVVIETLGAKGAKCFFDGTTFIVPGRKAVCADTTGAGDAFWGGFLSCLRLNGVEKTEQLTDTLLRQAMNYGNVAGWICVQSKGAIESLPTRAQIEAVLQQENTN